MVACLGIRLSHGLTIKLDNVLNTEGWVGRLIVTTLSLICMSLLGEVGR